MDGNGRPPTVTYRRFISAQELVRSEDQYERYDGCNNYNFGDRPISIDRRQFQTSDNTAIYGGRPANFADHRQFQSSDNLVIYGGPSNNLDRRNNYDFGPNPTDFRQFHSNNPAIYGDNSNQYESRNNYNIGHPANSTDHRQIQTSDNPAIYGVTSNESDRYGCTFGDRPISIDRRPFQSSDNPAIYGDRPANFIDRRPFQSSHNPSIYGSRPANFIDHRQLQSSDNPAIYGGRPANFTDRRQFQSSVNPVNYIGPSNEYGRYDGRNNYDFEDQPSTDPKQAYIPPMYEDRRQYQLSDNSGICGSNHQPSTDPKQAYIPAMYGGRRQYQLSDNSGICGSNPSEPSIDATSIIERGKIKMRIVDAYSVTAPKNFAMNLDNFKKDDWLKIYCSEVDGLKSYRSEMVCPLCFKKLTPQNRAKAGLLPRWDINGVKDHVQRRHSEVKNAGKDSSIEEVLFVKNDQSVEKDKSVEQDPTIEEKKSAEQDLSVEQNSSVKQNKSIEQDADVEHDAVVEKASDENAAKPLKNSILSSELLPLPVSESESESDSLEGRSSSCSTSLSYSSLDSDLDKTTVSRKRRRKRVKSTKSTKRGKSTKRRESLKTSGKKSRPSKIKQIPDWRKPGVDFGWVRFTSSARFLPAFIFPLEKNEKKRKAQQILSKSGLLADKKHQVDAIATPAQVEQAKKLPKSKPYVAAIKQFNILNRTDLDC